MKTSKLKVRGSKLGGVGVFAAQKIDSGGMITEITGNVIHWRTVISIGGVIQANTFRFSSEHYLSPDGIGNYVNHSCDPNAGIYKTGKRLFLKSIKTINPGQEITFDYSTIIGADDIWTMKCACGAASCRRKIKKFSTLPKNLIKKYIDLGAVPAHIIGTL